MTKKDLWNKFREILCIEGNAPEVIPLQDLFNYFDGDQLTDFYEFIKQKREV